MKNNRRFFVVIHTLTNGLQHVLEQTNLAKENGADGVFFIPDYAKGAWEATTEDQLAYLKVAKEKFPDFLIGANFLIRHLDTIASEIYAISPNLMQSDSSSLSGLDKSKLPHTEFFYGLAFKYSKNVGQIGEELRKLCIKVSEISDVPTTSGNATGESASIKKIEEILSYLPEEKRLGLASGVTIENVSTYLQVGVTDFLVATSLIERTDKLFDILNPGKIKQMSEIIHSF